MFAILGNDLNASDKLLTKLEDLSAVLEEKKWSSACEILQKMSEWKQSSRYFNSFHLLISNTKQEVASFCRYLQKMLGKCFELPSIADHGWKQNTKIWWIKEPFPKDKEEILFSVKYNKNEANDEEDESGNEGDQFLT